MRLLIVEDEKKMAGFLKKGLMEVGYSVDHASTGESAESLAAENLYDCVVLDVMLPDQTGFDTAANMRKDGYLGPILLLSALSSTKDKVRGLDSGADDYLTKPFSFDELLARIRQQDRDAHHEKRLHRRFVRVPLLQPMRRRHLCSSRNIQSANRAFPFVAAPTW